MVLSTARACTVYEILGHTDAYMFVYSKREVDERSVLSAVGDIFKGETGGAVSGSVDALIA